MFLSHEIGLFLDPHNSRYPRIWTIKLHAAIDVCHTVNQMRRNCITGCFKSALECVKLSTKLQTKSQQTKFLVFLFFSSH